METFRPAIPLIHRQKSTGNTFFIFRILISFKEKFGFVFKIKFSQEPGCIGWSYIFFNILGFRRYVYTDKKKFNSIQKADKLALRNLYELI